MGDGMKKSRALALGMALLLGIGMLCTACGVNTPPARFPGGSLFAPIMRMSAFLTGAPRDDCPGNVASIRYNSAFFGAA